jgi:hypothetical protein
MSELNTPNGLLIKSWNRGLGYLSWIRKAKELRRTLETAPGAESQNEAIRLQQLADELEECAFYARSVAASAVLLDEGVVH